MVTKPTAKPTDYRLCLAFGEHQSRQNSRITGHTTLCFSRGDTVAADPHVQCGSVSRRINAGGINNFNVFARFQCQTGRFDFFADDLRAPDEQRACHILTHGLIRAMQYTVKFSFGIHHLCGCFCGTGKDGLHQHARAKDMSEQLLGISVQV